MKVVSEMKIETKEVQFIRRGILRGDNIEFYYDRADHFDALSHGACSILSEVGRIQLEESDLAKFKTGDEFILYFIEPDLTSSDPQQNIGKLLAIVPTYMVKIRRGLSKRI